MIIEQPRLVKRIEEYLCLSSAGEVDCKDFALYTAGLLRFWGYVPIDYDLVGGLTIAAKPSWKLRSIYGYNREVS